MTKFLIFGCMLLGVFLGGCAGKNRLPENKREFLFNDGWQFHKGEIASVEAAKSEPQWRPVQLPHDWGVEGPFSQEWASGQGFLPGGIGWYRKSFDLPASASGKVVQIRFNGVYKHSQVWCNGKAAGGRPFGYMSFTLDLTPLVHFGGTNEIVVKVDHSDFADSRWYTGSGIFRNVFLVVTDKLHVAPNGTFVSTPAGSADEAIVDVQTMLRNDGADAAAVLVSTILDPRGNQVAGVQAIQQLAPDSSTMIPQRLHVSKPQLWSTHSPALYRLHTQVLSSGKLVDEYDTPFGIRFFTFDADKGFALNGESMKLKGVCLHEDAGALGAAIPLEVWRRRLSILQEAGCNAIRTSHNPPAPEFLDLCDQMGLLVMDEAFDEWTGGKNKWVAGRNRGQASHAGYNTDFAQWADIDVRDMVIRDRNHPSIIMWSIGNEIDYLNDPWPANAPELQRVAAQLVKDVKLVDTTRPVTAACAAVGTNLFVDLLDVAGYNYQEARYTGAQGQPNDHAQHPKRIIYGSENSQTPAAWEAVAQNDFIAGQFLWTGIDYLGEAGAWPNRGSAAGILDLAGFKKPRFYQRQALWSDQPMVYLTGNANGVTCYSNCETVALFHDGTLVGESPVPANKQITSAFSFTAGTLKAVGKKAGKEICSFETAAAGPAKKLAALPDVASLAPGGVAQIEVDVADGKGIRVATAANQINCTLKGPATLLGIESGDQSSHEDYKAPMHKAYQGRIMVYVRAEQPGTIGITFTADGLDAATVTLPV
ncbi:MAG TPA: glycoside hydrolase family 2 TIM barrel-domain containing protein, partial [Phycisphaerae bacterium]|nr:glycoside hydrolase family 2 TIM barrel-domain containing protein [Phycisphaerae bacterium]